MSRHFIDQEWTLANPVDLSVSLPPCLLITLYFPVIPSPSFSPSSSLFWLFFFASFLAISFSLSSSLPFSLSISWPPPSFPTPLCLFLSAAEVQSQGFFLLVIYFPISPLSEVHALGLSVCVGGTEGHPKERPKESKRGGHPGHTDNVGERDWVGGTEMKRERCEILVWCPSKQFCSLWIVMQTNQKSSVTVTYFSGTNN